MANIIGTDLALFILYNKNLTVMEYMDEYFFHDEDDLSPWVDHKKSQVAASCQTEVPQSKETKKIPKRMIYPV